MSNIYIEKYINFHTDYDPNVKQRGIQLYNKGRVRTAKFEEKTNTWTFNVLGTKPYTVKVKMNKEEIETTSCSCPYDWGTTCKHTVASLIYLDKSNFKTKNSQSSRIKKEPIKWRASNDSLELPVGFENLNIEYINNLRTNIFNHEWEWELHSIQLPEVIFKKNTITFHLNSYYSSSNTVQILRIDDKIFIQSSEKQRVSQGTLKKSEAQTLAIIANSSSPNLISRYFADNFEDIKSNILKTFALEKEDFDKYFEIKFNKDHGIETYKKPSAYGLMPSADNIKYFEELPENRAIAELIEVTSAAIKPKKKEAKKEIGFIISIIPEDFNEFSEYDDYDNGEPEFVMITGVSDKNNSTHLKKIKRFDSINNLRGQNITTSINQKEIIDIIPAINQWEVNKSKEEILRLFKLLENEKYLFARNINDRSRVIKKKDIIPVEISKEPAEFILEVYENDIFISADIKFRYSDNKSLIDINDYETVKNYGIIYDNNKIYKTDNLKLLNFVTEYDNFKISKSLKNQFYDTVIEPLSQNMNVHFKDDSYNVNSIELDFSKKQIFLGEEGLHITITPQVVYGEKAILLNKRSNILEKSKDAITQYKRNFELEDDFLKLLTELHPDFKLQKNEAFFYLHHEDFVKNMWFFSFFDSMQQNDVEVFGLTELKNFKYSPFKGKLSTSIKSGQDWFDVSVKLSFGNEHVTLNDIRKAVVNRQRYVQLKNGSVGILPSEWLTKLEKYFRNSEIKDNKLKVSKLRFSIIDDLFEIIDDKKIIEDLGRKRKMLSQFKEIEKVKAPKSIKAHLRDYQKEGLNWLNFLNKMQWGGILADDMGLGKTLQVLTFLQHISTSETPANLIVVPTTLLFNWQKEIAKFAPKIKALYHYGTKRDTTPDEFDKYDIVFSTYGILLRDIEMLKEYKFNYFILDESQAIKNPASRRYKAAILINTNNRLALTGTPIENSTFDLYAQMSFVNQGIFGSVNNFKTNYSNAIDKEGDEAVAVELQKIINPFVLRRTKEQVAKELPPKVEDVIYCEMDTAQRKVYDGYRNEYRNKLLIKIEKEGLAKSKFMVLEALTRLRQICDSPTLLKDDKIDITESVKIREIVNHITEKTAHHKILIFSQFVGMLTILRNEFTNHGIEFEYLDGKSSQIQREESVNNFQNNKKLRVFLISLKAGGTGLNLTAADYVYIVDPWWNPAVENQAIDRCYRIGQDKHVFAYRMICKDTIEEKILNLQAKKKKIAQDIIQTDEDIMKNIDINDISNLFG